MIRVPSSTSQKYPVPTVLGARLKIPRYATVNVMQIHGPVGLKFRGDWSECFPARSRTERRNRFCANETGRIWSSTKNAQSRGIRWRTPVPQTVSFGCNHEKEKSEMVTNAMSCTVPWSLKCKDSSHTNTARPTLSTKTAVGRYRSPRRSPGTGLTPPTNSTRAGPSYLPSL